MPRDCQAFATSILDGATALLTRPSTARPGAWNFATTRRNGTASLVASHGAKTTFGLLRCATPLIGARPGRSPLVLLLRASPMRDLTPRAVACRFKGSQET